MSGHFAEIILPLPLARSFTYRVPEDLRHRAGQGRRAVVPFGRHKIYTGVIYRLHHDEPVGYEPKSLIEILDETAIVTAEQFRLWEWMAEYYFCTLGEVMNASLPSGLKLQSESKISLADSFEKDSLLLDEKEQLVVEMLETKNVLAVREVEKITGNRLAMPLLKSMVSRGIVKAHEEVVARYKPLTVVYVEPAEKVSDEKFMQQVFSSLEKRAPAQLHLLMTFLKMQQDNNSKPVERTALVKTAGSSVAALNPLIRKNILKLAARQDMRIETEPGVNVPASVLSSVQTAAAEEIKKHFNEGKRTVLLHGVTSSGKTEIYIHLIEENLRNGKNVLFLLPEIALTAQIITRLQKHFSGKLFVYHSRYGDHERVEVYQRLINDPGNPCIITGARSAVLLPLANPGLIIVDEEHDGSFKQEDPAPRYNARDTAVMLAHHANCNIILGSATPSLESYHNAINGKYGLVKISERHAGLELPEIVLVNMKEEAKNKRMKSHFTSTLLEEMENALKKHEQVILFQNRRGFAIMLQCHDCGHIPECKNCDVTLTYHKKSNLLQCHYCNFSTAIPVRCQKCNSIDMRMRGFGTERIEDDLAIFFPNHKIARLDYDTTRSRLAYHRIITDFENRSIDILVGTQMVTKGLDFDNVSTVGILNADQLLSYPDFRAYERSFQLMMQVSGRAGRKNRRGKVIIQTFNTDHSIFKSLLAHDYETFFYAEAGERKRFIYPPYYRLIEVRMKHKEEKVLEELAPKFFKEVSDMFGSKKVLGPVVPVVPRIRNLYIRHILIKLGKEISPARYRLMLESAIDLFRSRPENRALQIQVDVDPA